jgi:hypothetical protein
LLRPPAAVDLSQEGEHLLAERVFDQRGLVGPVGAECLAKPVGFGFDAALCGRH